MRKTIMILSVFLAAIMAVVGSNVTAEKPEPAGFGQTYDEIVALAKKEGKVRVSTSDLTRRTHRGSSALSSKNMG